jgi:hypothetical protein
MEEAGRTLLKIVPVEAEVMVVGSRAEKWPCSGCQNPGLGGLSVYSLNGCRVHLQSMKMDFLCNQKVSDWNRVKQEMQPGASRSRLKCAVGQSMSSSILCHLSTLMYEGKDMLRWSATPEEPCNPCVTHISGNLFLLGK